jgi:hypothetical protein
VTTLKRSVVAGETGALARPTLQFSVDPKVLAFAVTVTATDVHGDHAEIESAGTP